MDAVDRENRYGDHQSFSDLGYPAIRFINAYEEKRNADPTDTIEFIEPEYLRRSTQAALALATALADGPRPPANIALRERDGERNELVWEPVAEAASYIIALRPPGSLIYADQLPIDETKVVWAGFSDYAGIAIRRSRRPRADRSAVAGDHSALAPMVSPAASAPFKPSKGNGSVARRQSGDDEEKMRIAHVIKVTRVSGAERHLLFLLDGLRRRGLDVRLIILVERDRPMDEMVGGGGSAPYPDHAAADRARLRFPAAVAASAKAAPDQARYRAYASDSRRSLRLFRCQAGGRRRAGQQPASR